MHKLIPSPFPGCVRRIGIMTPSKVIEPNVLENAVRMLEAWGVECVCAPHCTISGEETYFAADAVTRADDFNFLLRDDSIDLILCSRGGYGSAYMLERIDWQRLASQNLPVCGYSDVTALHLGMLAKRAGIPVSTQMMSGISDAARCDFTMRSMGHALSVAMGQNDAPQIISLRPLSIPENAAPLSAPLVVGNLSVMVSLCGTPWMPDLSGCILAVEDVDEEPRKIDRMLLQLDLCGIFGKVGSVIFGYFSGECGTDAEKHRIFRRFALRHPETPFFDGLPFGHILPSLSFVDGQIVRLDLNGNLAI